MKIGTMFCGKVQSIDSQSIQTKFFLLGLPLAPLESFYVLEEATNGVRGFEIPSHGESVVAGYLRWWSFAIAVGAGVYAVLGRDMAAMWLLVALGLGVWGYATFVYGKTSDEDFCRRVVFALETGLMLQPALLPDKMLRTMLDELRQKMEALSLGLHAQDHAELPPRSAFPLLYAFASYSAPNGGGAWGALANRVWVEILADEAYRAAFGARAPKK